MRMPRFRLTVRRMMVVVAIVAVCLGAGLQLRGCLWRLSHMHGPEYVWHRYLDAKTDEADRRRAAEEASNGARREEDLAHEATSPSLAARHAAEAARMRTEAARLAAEADGRSGDAKRWLRSFQEFNRGRNEP